ncbi:MAG: DUF1573 domain-containing protein [Chitinophagaceae bacterium]
MKKNFLLMTVALLIGGAAMAQPEVKVKKTKEARVTPVAVIQASPAQEVKVVEEKKAADMLWLNETTHDFGKIAQGKPVTTEFALKNTGKDSLKLEMVQAGCGCTTPQWKPGPYAPGQDFKITVGYNAAAEGAFTKPVTITYNGGQQKVINITGTVFSTPATPAPQNNGIGKVQN